MVYLQSPYLNANENFERYGAPEKESLLVPEQDDVRFLLQGFRIFVLCVV